MKIRQIVAGSNFSLLLTKAGELYTWGADLTIRSEPDTCYLVPTRFPHIDEAVTRIAAGPLQAAALTSEGTILWWGWYWSREADNFAASRPIRINIEKSDFPKVIDLAVDAIEVLVLTEDGKVWSFERPVGDDLQFRGPREIDQFIYIIAIAKSSSYDVALRHDGTVWIRVLADRVAHQFTASQHPYFFDVQQISGGSTYSTVLKKDGTVFVFGEHTSLGTRVGRGDPKFLIPTRVPGIKEPVGLIAPGVPAGHGVAVTVDNMLWAWGRNDAGQLGLGPELLTTQPNVNLPASQIKFSEIVKDLALGAAHTLALGESGSVWAWGINRDGQLGIGTQTDQARPVKVANVWDSQ